MFSMNIFFFSNCSCPSGNLDAIKNCGNFGKIDKDRKPPAWLEDIDLSI